MGTRHPPCCAARSSALAGPQVPAGVALERRRGVEQRLHDAPRLLDDLPAREERAVAAQGVREQAFVRLRRLAELLLELEIERDRLRDLLPRSLCADADRHPGVPADAEDDVVGAGRSKPVRAPAELRHPL